MNEEYFHLNNCKNCGSDNVCYDEKLSLKPGAWGGTVLKHKALCLDCKNSTGWYEKAEKARDVWNKGMTKKKSPKKAAFTAKEIEASKQVLLLIAANVALARKKGIFKDSVGEFMFTVANIIEEWEKINDCCLCM